MQRKDEKFEKYVFKASAVALSGSVRKPYYQGLGGHAAISTCAGAACRMTASSSKFALEQDVAYDSATSELTAQRDGQICRTIVQTSITNLRVGAVTARQVIGRLVSYYDISWFPKRKAPIILPVGSTIQGLRIGKDDSDREFKLPDAFTLTEEQQKACFEGKVDKNCLPGQIPPPIYVQGVGTIFLAEWTWVHPQEQHQQHLCMLRLALGSDFGAEADIGSVSSDGNGWPPYAL